MTASGTELSYKWFQRPATGSPVEITGATAASYTPPAIITNTTYFARVSSGIAYLDSADAVFTVCLPREINIVGTPAGVSGQSITLQVIDPAADETFEWYRGAAGITTDPLGGGTTKSIAPLATTTYWVRTKRTSCDADSAPVTITICYPSITAQPESSSLIPSGSTKTLTVAATGTAPLAYQWYQGAAGVTTNPVGTNSGTFTSPALTASTTYWVRIRTDVGTCSGKYVDSQLATVNVCQPPTITVQPQANILNPNQSHTVTVTATGDGLQYQWYVGESGDTSTPVGTNSNQYQYTATATKKYWVRVSGTCGTVNSVAALQSVKPTITAQPQNANVCGVGGNATFSVTATNADGYKWYRNSTELVGTAQTLTIAVPSSSVSFKVVVTSGDASATSQSVGVNIFPVPTVNSFTQTQETSTRWLLQATVAAADQGNVKYKFYEGALGDTSILLADTTTYYLRVFPASRPRTYWVAVYYPSTGCSTNRAVTIP